jgi:hypothetical protein
MRTMNIFFHFILISLLLLVSCRSDRFKINTSGIKVEIKIKRLEQDLFTISPTEVKTRIPELKGKYHKFLKYFGYVINIGEENDSTWSDGLVNFCTGKINNEVYGYTVQMYPDVKDLESKLTEGFKHYRYYFPGKPVPQIYSCIAGFNNSIITAVEDTLLGICLDKYLGSDCKYYPALGIYKYQSAKMNSFNIVPDCIYAWVTSVWDFKGIGYKEDYVLTEMIHEGKLIYLLKCMLPDLENNLILGFSPGQLKFCTSNESQMWQYLAEQNLLFSSEQLTKRKLIGDAPFTSYFSKESPGRAAAWIGFRIVSNYMSNNRDISLEDLMKNTDIQGILEKAKYSPK